MKVSLLLVVLLPIACRGPTQDVTDVGAVSSAPAARSSAAPAPAAPADQPAHRDRMDEVRRNEHERKSTEALPRQEFAILDRSAHDFFAARERAEVDHTGTLRSALQIAEHAALEDAYGKALAQVSTPGFPPPADAAALEAELDAVYLALLRCPAYGVTKDTPAGAVTSNGIRDTQRLWREYRDAWVALGTKARPGTSADAWKAVMTRERIDMLKRLAKGC